MLIEIKGVQFVNKGAELMLHAILEKAKTIWPEAEFCLVPNNNSPYLARSKMTCYQKLNFRKNIIDLASIFYLLPNKIRHYFKSNWGIVTEADVDMILDASGFTYGDQWTTLMLKQTAREAVRLKKKGKHYVFMPQALGPFSTSANKAAAQHAFNAASIVFAREQTSFVHAKSCASSANIQLAPDFTNLLTSSLAPQYQHLQQQIAIIPNSKMLSKKNTNALWRSNYIHVLCEIIKAFTEQNQQLFLLNHEGTTDQEICEKINQHLEHKLSIVSPNSAKDVKAIIGNCKAIVCSRYHGCVSALSQAIPCLATSWSHKYEMLFTEYQVDELLLNADISVQQIRDKVAYIINNKKEITTKLQPNINKYKEASEVMWQQLEKSIN